MVIREFVTIAYTISGCGKELSIVSFDSLCIISFTVLIPYYIISLTVLIPFCIVSLLGCSEVDQERNSWQGKGEGSLGAEERRVHCSQSEGHPWGEGGETEATEAVSGAATSHHLPARDCC